MCLGGGVTPNRYHPARRTCIGSPPSGSGVETVTWQWMQYPDRREEAVGGAGELLPAHECTLAASFERLEPTPSHLVEVPPQARAVSGNGIVVQVPFEHPLQPCSGLGNGVVHSKHPKATRPSLSREIICERSTIRSRSSVMGSR